MSPTLTMGVLLIEDHWLMRSAMEEGLRQGGFRVWTAANGREGIDLYRRFGQEIDMVLSAVEMPGLDGLETLAALREIDPFVRCCFMTCDARQAAAADLLGRGAARVFAKPFFVAEVLVELRKLAACIDRPSCGTDVAGSGAAGVGNGASSDPYSVEPSLAACSTTSQVTGRHNATDPNHLDATTLSAPATWFRDLKTDVPASLVVFAVALPLCVAIAKACGVPTASGIITVILGGVVVGLLGGGHLQVSGPTAGLIVILLDVGEQLGFASLGAVVFLAGLMQVAAGLLRLGQWFRAVSPAVILGLLAGIGVVLFSQQFHVAADDPISRSPLMNVLNIPHTVVDTFREHGHPGHVPAALVGLLTLAILLLWPLTPKRLRAIPAVLVAVVATTTAATVLHLPIQRVTFDGLFSGAELLDIGMIPGLLGEGTVWKLAGTVAIVASAETLLTAAAVDQMHARPRTNYDRELAAQGVGNAFCGLLGALPMASVIVRSATNVQAGAKTRWATVLHGVWMPAFSLLLPGLLCLIPTAALAAALVLTGIRLIQFRVIRALWRESWGEGMICVAVAVAVVAVGLLAGVMLGIALSVVRLVYTFSRLRIRRRGDRTSGRMTLVLEGSATFLRLPKLAAALETVPSGTALHVDLQGLSYIDHACLTLLMNWEKQHEAAGGKLVLDRETLRARFRHANPRPRAEVPARAQ